jgi:hypothetical protein
LQMVLIEERRWEDERVNDNKDELNKERTLAYAGTPFVGARRSLEEEGLQFNFNLFNVHHLAVTILWSHLLSKQHSSSNATSATPARVSRSDPYLPITERRDPV